MKLLLTTIGLAMILQGCSVNPEGVPPPAPLIDPSSPQYFNQRLNALSQELDAQPETARRTNYSKVYYQNPSEYSSPASDGVPFFLMDVASRNYNVPVSGATLGYFNQQWVNALLGAPSGVGNRYILHLIRSTISGLP